MAEELQKNETPQAGSTLNAQIFTMPESYRHGKEAKMVEPVVEHKSAPVVVLAPAPKPPTLQKPHTQKQTHKALLIAGVFVLLAVAISGYLLLRSAQKQSPSASDASPTPEATPTVIPQTSTPVEESVIQTQPTQSPFVTEVIQGKDSDSDGLTDFEETNLYKTDPRLPDTDSDGFLDGNEVFHRYNPNGTAPGTLLEAGIVSSMKVNETIHLSYPAGWTFTDLASQPPAFSFVSTTGETMNMIVYFDLDESENQNRLTTWISIQGGQERVVQTLSKPGYKLYLAQDNRHAFLVVGQQTFEFTYELGGKTTLDYLQTFKMMLNSVSL